VKGNTNATALQAERILHSLLFGVLPKFLLLYAPAKALKQPHVEFAASYNDVVVLMPFNGAVANVTFHFASFTE
jgi:hypothetical protein